ncbi:hypothetical protein DFAR_2800022 [Desulfarculales bacterium]
MSLPPASSGGVGRKNQKQVVLLTNHHKLTVSIVADIYRDH